MCRADAAIQRSLAWTGSCSASAPSAGVAELRYRSQQRVAGRDDSRRRDRLLQPVAAFVTPASNKRSIAELGNRDGSEEQLATGHETDLGLEPSAAASADGRTEDAGVDNDPHDSSAAANASSSSSESSSMSRESIESSIGAASS